jgi:preprotein translocase subunit SecY
MLVITYQQPPNTEVDAEVDPMTVRYYLFWLLLILLFSFIFSQFHEKKKNSILNKDKQGCDWLLY